jgi:hypothetical protein
MKNPKSTLATILGALTSVVTAIAVIDFNTFDITKFSNIMKLIVIAIPALSGYFSEFKTTK